MFENLKAFIARFQGEKPPTAVPDPPSVYLVRACPDCVAAIETGMQGHLSSSQRDQLGRQQAQAQLHCLLHEAYEAPATPQTPCALCGAADRRNRAMVRVSRY